MLREYHEGGEGMAEDYYSILGVTKDATSQEIKRAFREIARKSHPDLAGSDPAAEEQFKNARKAYETLMDPVARARYDRRGQRTAPAGGSFFDAFYKATERAQTQKAPSTPRGATGKRNPGNSVTLDDLFNDFGDFGFGEGKGATPPPRQSEVHRPSPKPGDDVHIDLDVPEATAKQGGSLTAVYYRMQRADSWRPGSPDPGVVRVQDIADIRVMPGTPHGEILRERGLGNAGQHGGPYGDLLVRIQIVKPPPAPEPKPEPRPEPELRTPPEPAPPGAPTVDLSIVEAILGGRVAIDTPQGRVRLTIPPGTSSGVQLRIRGRGVPTPEGEPTDYFVWTRIVVPKEIDEASRRLIEEFGRLNPSPTEEP